LLAVQLFDYFQANMSAMGHSGWNSKEAGELLWLMLVVDISEINQ